MPSAKPDKETIKLLVKQRYPRGRPDNIFEPIQEAAERAVRGGSTSADRSVQLLNALDAFHHLDFFPYNTLRHALCAATEVNEWSSSNERDLLVFITAIFSGSQDISSAVDSLLSEQLPLFGSLYPKLFDSVAGQVSLHGKLCSFTGPFSGRSRRECYQSIADEGGVPSDAAWYTDYLFVANEHKERCHISNSMAAAIDARATYGLARILSEPCFLSHGPY